MLCKKSAPNLLTDFKSAAIVTQYYAIVSTACEALLPAAINSNQTKPIIDDVYENNDE